MNLRDLLAIQALVAAGTTKGAAVNIGVSQPTVSRAVVEMETLFGRQLFARQHGRLVPTAAALRISRSALEINGIIQGLYAELDAKAAEQVLRVGVPSSFDIGLLGQAVKHFGVMQPGVTIRISAMPEADLCSALLESNIDLALCTGPQPASGIEAEHLLTLDLRCIMPAGHRLTELAEVTPGLLAREPIVWVMSDDAQSRRLHAAFRDANVTPFKRLEVTTASLAIEFVSNGMGVTFSFLGEDCKPGLVARPFLPSIKNRVFSLVCPTGTMYQPARQFCRLVRMTNKAADSQPAASVEALAAHELATL